MALIRATEIPSVMLIILDIQTRNQILHKGVWESPITKQGISASPIVKQGVSASPRIKQGVSAGPIMKKGVSESPIINYSDKLSRPSMPSIKRRIVV
jgi:hypothetical protein